MESISSSFDGRRMDLNVRYDGWERVKRSSCWGNEARTIRRDLSLNDKSMQAQGKQRKGKRKARQNGRQENNEIPSRLGFRLLAETRSNNEEGRDREWWMELLV